MPQGWATDWTLVIGRRTGPHGRTRRHVRDDCAADVDDRTSPERERKDLYTGVETSTTLPANASGVRGGELSHALARPMAASSRDAPSDSTALNIPTCAAPIAMAAPLR